MINNLIHTTEQLSLKGKQVPFYLYSAIHAQNLKNILITKPTLIAVMRGHKQIGAAGEISCNTGEFILLSDHKLTAVRNIPDKNEYLAFILEFEAKDFEGIPASRHYNTPYIIGKLGLELQELLEQFVKVSEWAPQSLLSRRKHEILMLLYHLGYLEITALGKSHSLSHRIHEIFIQHRLQKITIQKICDALFMSESTLRRRLQLENQSIRGIKASAQLGYGLHLLQTTQLSIQQIAEQCGYQSHSRFTENFKKHFGLTPRELRKTKYA